MKQILDDLSSSGDDDDDAEGFRTDKDTLLRDLRNFHMDHEGVIDDSAVLFAQLCSYALKRLAMSPAMHPVFRSAGVHVVTSFSDTTVDDSEVGEMSDITSNPIRAPHTDVDSAPSPTFKANMPSEPYLSEILGETACCWRMGISREQLRSVLALPQYKDKVIHTTMTLNS